VAGGGLRGGLGGLGAKRSCGPISPSTAQPEKSRTGTFKLIAPSEAVNNKAGGT
jgi:hypothetical protein